MQKIIWRAVYEDGSGISQIENDGSTNKYQDIDRTKLKFFELWKENKLLFRLHLEEGRRLIYRRRVTINMNARVKWVVYLIGWQQTIQGRNVQDIAYIFEDGHVELAGKWKDDRTFCAPNFIDCERGGE